MARQKGTANLAASLEVLAGAPLDSRSIVPTLADLSVAANFPYKYIGMNVTVQATGNIYTLMNMDVTAEGAWKKQGSEESGSNNVVEGYFNSQDDLFYEDNQFTTAIEGAAEIIYVDLDTNLTYRFDDDQDIFVRLDEGGSGSAELESAVTSNTAVGAIPSGTTLPQGTSFTEFVQKLLISEVAPTINFSISKSGNVEVGDSYTETLTLAVSNMGSAKKIKTIAWYEGNTLKQTDTIDSTTTGSWTYTMGTATTQNTTFKAIVTYTKSDDTDISVTKTASISFYYKKFYGGVSDINPSEATVEALTGALATAKGGTYNFTVTAGRICYAYPKSLGALTSIKDGNGFSLFDSFTRTEQNYTQHGNTVAYYRYVLTDATTVSGYSVIFV